MFQHERVCKFRPYICPYIECDHKLAADAVVMHVSTAHRFGMELLVTQQASINLGNIVTTWSLARLLLMTTACQEELIASVI